MEYAELICRSNFSFLQGASHPAELVKRAHELGYRAIALTDESSVSGVVQAHITAKQLGIAFIVGAQFQLPTGQGRMVCLAMNRAGYAQLSLLITQTRQRELKGCYRLTEQDLISGLPDCIGLWLPAMDQPVSDQHQTGQWFKSLFADRAYLGCALLLRGNDAAWRDHLRSLGALCRLPLLATSDVLMHRRSRKPLADTLTAIRHGLPVAACGRRHTANAEQHLRTRLRLSRIYPEDLLARTVEAARRCHFSLDELRYEYPEEIVPKGLTPTQWLRHLTEEGARKRFPNGLTAAVRQQIEHELSLIHELQYEAYFLTVYDIVAFARGQGILCQGRGSAANSAVCYCLGITEVDPERMNVLFERFISKERNEPPDIDVDFEHQRREEVIQYIYQKYGRSRAALAASIVTYRPRSALRDTGKALGLPPLLVEAAAKNHQWWDGRTVDPAMLEQSVAEIIETAQHQPQSADMAMPARHQMALWALLCNQLIGFPRHLSQHVGGFVIARHRLSDLVPVENAAMPERSVIQWDKNDIEALGLLKVDILALGMLSAIRRALELIGQKLGRTMQMQDVPPEDQATYDMICAADTIGVFQIESRAQMTMLPRLKPRSFYDLVIEVAIVRPGPIQGGMVHPYLRRRQGLEAIDYPGPGARQALSRTLGVPIFQEQVMQLAILAAGFTPGEADQLRRSMAAWRQNGGLGHFYDRIIDGMLIRGYPKAFAERVFRQIEGFGAYGFPESHAASFALLVYVSCWIKRHHPDAFLAALLNAQPLGFYSPSQLIQDAKRHGVQVLPADVQESAVESSIHPHRCQVRLGLDRIHSLSAQGMTAIVTARTASGPFQSTEDLARRAGLRRSDLNALAASGALKSLSGHRHQAVWQASGLVPMPHLLRESRINEPALSLPAPSEAEDLMADYASLGLTLGRHPLALLRPALLGRKIQTAADLSQLRHGRLARAAGLVTHRQRPPTAKGTLFLSLEDETGIINLVVWPDVLERFYKAALYAELILVYGVWQRDQTIDPDAPGQVCHLLAQRIEDQTVLLQQLAVS